MHCVSTLHSARKNISIRDAKYCVSTVSNIKMKHNIILTKKNKSVKGTVHLTGSKSECNRALVIEALSNGKVKVENISDAADTVTLAGILKSEVGMPNAEVLLIQSE